MTHRIHYAARTDRGLLRANNQDSVYAGERLFIVADGMGGHAAGDVASRLVVDAFMPLDDLPLGVDMRRPLVAATREGNAAIAEMVDANPELDGMGTTMTALLFDGANAALAHVGDSRAYLYRNGVLHQISHDDTFVQSLVDDGRITSDEAAHHPQRSLLLRALNGSHMDPRINLREVSAGDRFLVCSDGLSDYVSPESIADALADPEPDQVADTLIQLALVAGGPDNITVIVADVVSTGAEQVPGAAVDGDAAPSDPEATGPLQAIHLTQRMPRVPLPAIPEEPAAPAEFAAADDEDDDDDDDDEEERDSEADEQADGRRRSLISPPRRHVKHRAVWILAVVVVLVAAGLGTVLYARSRYFVSTDAGTVVVFRGVDGSLFGWRFANAVENSCAQTTGCSPLQVSDLQQGARDQVSAGIPVNTLADARAVIDRLSSQMLPLCDSLTVPGSLNSTSSPSPTSTASGPTLGSPTLLGSGPVVTTLVTVTAGRTPDTVPATSTAPTSSTASSEESPSPTSPPQRARLQIPTPRTTARTGKTTVRASGPVKPSTHPSPTHPSPTPSPTPTTSTVTSTLTFTPTPTPGITLTASPEPGVNCRSGH